MVLTQESVLSLLIAQGGKVKKSDLVGEFKALIDCVDPAQRERNRELFRTFVNNVAFVKEIDGVRYVVIKKMYQHLLESGRGNEEIPVTGEQRRPPESSEQAERSEGAGGDSSADQDLASESGENPSELPTAIELALQNTKYSDIRIKRAMNFERSGEKCSGRGPVNPQSKPYGLPLRMPPSATRVEVHKLKLDSCDAPETPKVDPCRNKKSPPLVETDMAVKSTKVPEEPRDIRVTSLVPLEQLEHEWLVKCASGHWSQVYGLLLKDNQLAEKRDFISGFTALHWAAKCGNSDMLVKIMDISREGGVGIDINTKTHGGYTPLHIAALHNQEYMMAMLVGEYRANVSIRDNCGKKACHYLHKETSETLREMMMGRPKAQQAQDAALHEKEELDLIPDLSKGRHSISRLFQPHVTGHKRKDKQRPGFYSLTHDPSDDREETSSSMRNRIVSDAFM